MRAADLDRRHHLHFFHVFLATVANTAPHAPALRRNLRSSPALSSNQQVVLLIAS